MEEDEWKRQSDARNYGSSSSRHQFAQDAGRGRGYEAGAADQYRGAQLHSTPGSGRGIPTSSSYSAYYPNATQSFPAAIHDLTPTSSLQYQQQYMHDRQQSAQPSAYNTNMMFGLSQSSHQPATFDNSQQFQGRQSGPIQMPPAPYYQPESSSGMASAMMQQQSSAAPTYQPVLQSLGSNMDINLMDLATVPKHEPEAPPNSSGNLEEAYDLYQTALKEIFYNIQECRLSEAASIVLRVSKWLLEHAVQLGLTSDDASLYEDRMELWEKFNHAWLALFQRQKDMTQDFLNSGDAPRPPQNLLTKEDLWNMSQELVKLVDKLEGSGLIDYQLGVWEERIIEILSECLDLLEDSEGSASSDIGQASR